MSGPLGEWVNDLAKQYNESQKEYKVVPTFKGTYDENMTAAIAAFRAGNAPHILQVYEVQQAAQFAGGFTTAHVDRELGSDDDDAEDGDDQADPLHPAHDHGDRTREARRCNGARVGDVSRKGVDEIERVSE